MIEIKNISKTFKNNKVLDGIDLMDDTTRKRKIIRKIKKEGNE